MRENRGERVEKGAARRKLGRTAGEKSSREADHIAILDYVIRDFGPPEESRRDPGIRRFAPGIPETIDDLV